MHGQECANDGPALKDRLGANLELPIHFFCNGDRIVVRMMDLNPGARCGVVLWGDWLRHSHCGVRSNCFFIRISYDC